jgi:Membrane bound O-acyl transferase family
VELTQVLNPPDKALITSLPYAPFAFHSAPDARAHKVILVFVRMFAEPPTSYGDFLTRREHAFRSALRNGEIQPFVLPRDIMPTVILILTVLLLPNLSFKHQRWMSFSSFVLLVFYSASVMQRCRSIGMGNGYGIGLMSVWSIVWSAVLLVYNDPKVTFKRVERRDAIEHCEDSSRTIDSVVANRTFNSNPRKRKTDTAGGRIWDGRKDDEPQERKNPSRYLLVWQAYPQDIFHRLDWVMDLCMSFRGPGWNWHIQTLSSAPYPSPTSPALSLSSRKPFTRRAIRDFILWYIVLDAIKTAVTHDPYFWGLASISSPATNVAYLPSWISRSPPLSKIYRLLLSLAGMFSALSFIFTLSPLTYAILVPFFKLDQLTRSPLLEPLLYPPFWGSFVHSVLDRGLAGWWGSWWHQLFRVGMSEPSRVLVEQFGLNARSLKAKCVRLVIAFGISGIIHAGGRSTTFSPEARPLFGSFLFFIFQAFGIVAEQVVFDTLGISKTLLICPGSLKRAGTLIYLMIWFYISAPWFIDDIATGGVWLFEPVPISIFRGLGLGAEGLGWWCWHGEWATWWSGLNGTPWWRKGIAIL